MNQFLINKRERTGLKHFNDSKTFIEFFNGMDDFHKNIEEYNPNKTQPYFAVPKIIRLNSTHYFIMKIPNKQEPQQTAFNHSSDTDFKNFMNLYKKFTAILF